MKRHGLWVFHRNASALRNQTDGRRGSWWESPDEVDFIHRRAERTNSFYCGVSYAEMIIACIERYARMFHGTIRSVGDYNEIANAIIVRSGWTHSATRRSVLFELHLYRERTVVRVCGPNSRLAPRFMRRQIMERAKSLSDARDARRWRTWDAVQKAKDDVTEINRAIRKARAAIKDGVHA